MGTADISERPLPFDPTVTEPQVVAFVCGEPGAVVVGLVVDVEVTVVDVVVGVGGSEVEDGVAAVEVDVEPFSDGPAVVEGAPLVVTVDPADEVDVGPPWSFPEASTGVVESGADLPSVEAGSWPSEPVVTVEVVGASPVVEEIAELSAGPVTVVTLLVGSG